MVQNTLKYILTDYAIFMINEVGFCYELDHEIGYCYADWVNENSSLHKHVWQDLQTVASTHF